MSIRTSSGNVNKGLEKDANWMLIDISKRCQQIITFSTFLCKTFDAKFLTKILQDCTLSGVI